jgi:UPF0755 protein
MASQMPRPTDGWSPPGTRAVRLRTLVLVLACGLLAALVLQGWWIMTPGPAVRSGPKVIELPPQRGFLDIVAALDEAQVIRSPVAFGLLALARGSVRSLKAGEYQIPHGANSLAVLRLLEGGQVLQHTIVFREGSTLGELARQLASSGLARTEDVLRVAQDPMLLRQLEVKAGTLEGYLFPDTYQLVKGMTPEEILARMVARLRERLTPEIGAAAEARELSLHQLLTLASIIEKEAVERSEMTLISAVFWNRLRREMPLQADPTVQYAVGKERQRLTRDDLQTDHPYNTYRRPGLPPGPIASPGLSAIRAAVAPAPVAFLYFVAVDERRHKFSTTLADHNAAVAQARQARGR